MVPLTAGKYNGKRGRVITLHIKNIFDECFKSKA